MEFPLDEDHTELDALLDKVFAALDEENIETIYKSDKREHSCGMLRFE